MKSTFPERGELQGTGGKARSSDKNGNWTAIVNFPALRSPI